MHISIYIFQLKIPSGKVFINNKIKCHKMPIHILFISQGQSRITCAIDDTSGYIIQVLYSFIIQRRKQIDLFQRIN